MTGMTCRPFSVPLARTHQYRRRKTITNIAQDGRVVNSTIAAAMEGTRTIEHSMTAQTSSSTKGKTTACKATKTLREEAGERGEAMTYPIDREVEKMGRTDGAEK